MKSRFAQFFVWPELMKFSRSTQFVFDISSFQDPEIQGEGLSYQIKAPLVAKMWAPRGGSYTPFMKFTLPFTSRVQLRVNSGKIAAIFDNSNLEILALWDASYVDKYRPYQRFSSSTIRNRMLSGIAGKTVTVGLPEIPIAEGVTLKVQKLLAPKGEDLVLQLAP